MPQLKRPGIKRLLARLTGPVRRAIVAYLMQLGVGFLEKPSLRGFAGTIETALRSFDLAIRIVDQESELQTLAKLWQLMGIALSGRMKGDPAENLEFSIQYLIASLQVFTKTDHPIEWALTQLNLSVVYQSRLKDNRADNFERAMECATAALTVFSTDATPTEWAATKVAFGGAYLNRIRGERNDNLERAIQCFLEAQKIMTRESDPFSWAINMLNTGCAHYLLADSEHYESALHYLSLALEVLTRAHYPVAWAKAQVNLSAVYSDLFYGDREENLDRAIHHGSQALSVLTRQLLPFEWATTQSILGHAYLARTRGGRDSNWREAIRCLQFAQEILTLQDYPERWAAIQNTFGRAYSERPDDEQTFKPDLAIQHFKDALRVFDPKILPDPYRLVNRNLASVLFAQRNWGAALDSYHCAIETGDSLREAAFSDSGRRFEVAQNADIHGRAAYCLARLGLFGEALELLERGKTQVLADALALTDVPMELEHDTQGQELAAALRALRQAEYELFLATTGSMRHNLLDLSDALRQSRARLMERYAELTREKPGSPFAHLNPSEILSVIPPGGALVAPVITEHGCMVFVIPHGVVAIDAGHILWIDELTDVALQNLLRGTEDMPGWLRFYADYHDTGNRTTWKDTVEATGQALWSILIGPIHGRLRALGVAQGATILWMPSGGLQLLPVQAAWRWTDGSKRAWLDDHIVVVTPSARVARNAHRRVFERKGQECLAVGVSVYTEASRLENAVPEATTVARLFQTTALCDAAVTKEAIRKGLAEANYIHFACHGEFRRDEPRKSALLLSEGQSLSLAEIVGTTRLDQALLVTLSACETGISDVRRSSDEFLGLPAGFLEAGAAVVVGSLWLVDDRSTALLMERFYHNHLEKGMTLPAALREAQLWLRDATVRELGEHYKTLIRMSSEQAFLAHHDLVARWSPDDRPYQSPYYWAAYTYNGG